MTNKQLIKPSQEVKKTLDGQEVSITELESLCGDFNSRPRGCNNDEVLAAGSSFDSSGNNDDVLF